MDRRTGVYVDSEWSDKVGERNASEAALLEFLLEPRSSFRLSCQIVVRDDMDGLVVPLPEVQGI